MEKAKPVPAQEAVHEKEPLQLAVQLLKRWRDLAFADECLAPISVVLTTLAGMHYGGEESVSEALTTILAGIVNAIVARGFAGYANCGSKSQQSSRRLRGAVGRESAGI